MEILLNGPINEQILLLAHGAGAPMDSEFMNTLALELGELGVSVARFEFSYMQKRRLTGKKSPPDRQEKLLTQWKEVIESFGGAERLVIGGKSLGGRMATMIATKENVKGVVCLGYPFHPVGKPEKLRVNHLKDINKPTLIVQGERDALGSYEEVKSYDLPKQIKMHWLPDGDHSFKPRIRSGYLYEDHMSQAALYVAQFVKSL